MGVLLTGGTGLLGANLAHALGASGIRPRLLVRERSDRRGLAGLAYDEARGDLLEPSSLDRALEGVDTVYHLAALVRFDPLAADELRRAHVQGTSNVLEAARKAGVSRFVHVSGAAAVGYGPRSEPATEESPFNYPPGSPYHEAKREAEAAAREANGARLTVLIANPAFVVGAYDVRPSSGELLLQVARGRMRAYPPGGNTFVNAADVAQGLMLLAERGRGGERYLFGGEDLTYREFFTQCAQECGAPAPVLPVSGSLILAAARAADVVARWSPTVGRVFNRSMLEATAFPAYVSSGKAMRELGYRPTPVRLGIRAAYRWFQEHGYLPRDRPLTPRAA